MDEQEDRGAGYAMNCKLFTISFCAGDFVKVFVNSFRKYYPNYPLTVVDNNYEEEPETRFLKGRKDITIIRDPKLKPKDIHKCSHAAAMDFAFRLAYTARPRIDMLIHIDIDSLFLKKGVIEQCEGAYQKGFLCGGAYYKMAPDNMVRFKEIWQVHTSLCFYSVKLINHFGVSFRKKGNHDTAEVLNCLLNGAGVKPFPMKGKGNESVYHVGGGSYSCSPDKKSKKALFAMEKRKAFFEREDVREYLV